MNDTRHVYVAYTNTDCTEGRGRDVPIAVCALESTALRLARQRYVQGSDGPVRRIELLKIDGLWYVPALAVDVIEPTKEDEVMQKQRDVKRAAIEKARAAGLTDDEINALGT